MATSIALNRIGDIFNADILMEGAGGIPGTRYLSFVERKERSKSCGKKKKDIIASRCK